MEIKLFILSLSKNLQKDIVDIVKLFYKNVGELL